MFCSREKKFISGKGWGFLTTIYYIFLKENKNKVLRRKYVLAPFSRGNLFFIPQKTFACEIFQEHFFM